jgi:hypothetical protein
MVDIAAYVLRLVFSITKKSDMDLNVILLCSLDDFVENLVA